MKHLIVATPLNFIFIIFSLGISFPFSSSTLHNALHEGSSLSVEKPDNILHSSNGIFSAGFYPVGENAYSFAIWFTQPSCINTCTVVWMANRDIPVNGERSKLSLQKTANLILTDAGIFSAGFYPVGENAYSFAIWFTQPSCINTCTVVWMANRDIPVNGERSKLSLQKTANLILTDAGNSIIWSSDTFSLSPSSLNLYDNGNLVLITTKERVILWQSFDSPTETLLPLQPFTRNSVLVSSRSSTNFSSGFYKLSFDNDNILRLVYDGPEVSSAFWPSPWLLSREAGRSSYNSSRFASLDLSGKFTSSDNFSFLSSDYGVQNIHGCESEIDDSCGASNASFLKFARVEMYGYDLGYFENHTYDMCKEICLKRCDCKGFVFKYIFQNRPDNVPYCFPKTQLLNGYRSPNFRGNFYLKVPETMRSHDLSLKERSLECSIGAVENLERRTFSKRKIQTISQDISACLLVLEDSLYTEVKESNKKFQLKEIGKRSYLELLIKEY
ncbi:G-type lectin S-receptor-like serine/threonine-protein kinase At1g61420 [Jatropha curcas]|uniref:G-type lectin S-receptor-like serine/threonine-protein kinase At1g61420 n=1 Tax=Jatropha curcas TaxID=180498 RepID=UPI001895FDEB|nr:G-type lectin S-receptor-like serine/threonine-protein kinase At1g61420 [Jatropha curcas]